MSIFDLTFSGTVLEDHSAEQVKTDLGRFLDIDDPTLLETLFSGETFVLRSNLDRKTAAEYFSEISELGGKVELVRWKRGPSISTEFARLDQTEGLSARILRGSTEDALGMPPQDAANKLWPVSAAHSVHPLREKQPSKIADSPNAADDIEIRETLAAQQVLDVVRAELKRLQVRLHAIKTEAQKESEALEHRIAHFKRIGEEEREKIETSIAYCAEHRQTRTGELENSAAACEEKAREKTVELETQSKLAAQQAKTEIDRLHGLIIEAEDAERAVMEELACERSGIEEQAEKDIQDLQEQINDVRSKADSDLKESEEKAREHRANWENEMLALRQEQEEIQGHAQRSIENFELQLALANESLVKDLALLAQEREDFHQCSDSEISDLRIARNVVLEKEADGVARAEQADEKIRLRSKKDLQRLHAVKLDLQRRETEALNRTITVSEEKRCKEKPLNGAS